MRIPTATQRVLVEEVTGARYGTWWRAPWMFRDFAYYMLLRRTYDMTAAEALARLRAFAGGPRNFMANLRASTDAVHNKREVLS